MLPKPSRLALAVALAAVAGCGGGSSPTQPPVTTPSPTPAPTPTATPSASPTPSSTSCRYGMGTIDSTCGRRIPAFLDDVDAAIDLLGQQQPALFDFDNTVGPGGWRVRDAGRYVAGVIKNLEARAFCAESLNVLQVKNSNDFSEEYSILLSDGHVRRGAGSYRNTCTPANFPLDPKDLIDSVRVAFFGFKCPDGVAVPPNGAGRLPVGCTGNVTATPKNKDNADVDPRVHGSQIAWTLEQEGSYVQQIDFPDQPFNKSLLGLALGHFSLCAVVKEVQGCLHGEVVAPTP